MVFKAGQRVKVKSLGWFDENSSERSKEIIEKIVDSKIEEDDCQLILDKLNEVIEELNAEYKED